MTYSIKATIYGKGDESQTLSIEYEFIIRSLFFQPDKYEVNYLKVKDTIKITPSDLEIDLEQSIAEHLGVDPWQVRIKCEVESKQIVKSVIHEEEMIPLFI